MNKTLELRSITYSLLTQSQGQAYYEDATDNAVYPYKVYHFENIDLGDISRDDLILVVDVWGKKGIADVKVIDSICDEIERDLNCITQSTSTSFPTFYRMDRNTIPDEDKAIKHKQLKFQVQNYYIGA